MVIIALPYFSLRLGSSDAGNDPKDTTTRQAYDLLSKGFGPGSVGPLQLTSEIRSPADQAVLTKLQTGARAAEDVAAVSPPIVIAGNGRQVAVINVIPKSAPQDEATTKLVDRLRKDVVPQATAGSEVVTHVGGNTAVFEDFSGVLSKKLPLFIGIVVLLSYVLLTLLFRSLIVPLVASLMNLLSVGAAFGVVVAVFQWGWAGGLIGVSRPGPVESFLPVMLFAILFGLSTDYEVFLVSRIHEEWLRTNDNRKAVVNGLAETGKTITAAASIMFLVFAAFILGGERVIKEFGLGFAAAIALDALIIRTALVPAITLMIGKRNWWLPGWLDRALPHVGVEPETPDDTPGERTGDRVSVS
jgi:putative drug exporter of the RND superfamily